MVPNCELLRAWLVVLIVTCGANCANVRFSKLLNEKSEALRFTSIANTATAGPFQNIYSRATDQGPLPFVPTQSPWQPINLASWEDSEVSRIREQLHEAAPTSAEDFRESEGILTVINQKPVSGRTQVTALRQSISPQRLNISPVFLTNEEDDKIQQQFDEDISTDSPENGTEVPISSEFTTQGPFAVPMTTQTPQPSEIDASDKDTANASASIQPMKEGTLTESFKGEEFPDFEDLPTNLVGAESSQPARVNVRPASSGKNYEYEYIYYYYDDDDDNTTSPTPPTSTQPSDVRTRTELPHYTDAELDPNFGAIERQRTPNKSAVTTVGPTVVLQTDPPTTFPVTVQPPKNRPIVIKQSNIPEMNFRPTAQTQETPSTFQSFGEYQTKTVVPVANDVYTVDRQRESAQVNTFVPPVIQFQVLDNSATAQSPQSASAHSSLPTQEFKPHGRAQITQNQLDAGPEPEKKAPPPEISTPRRQRPRKPQPAAETEPELQQRPPPTAQHQESPEQPIQPSLRTQTLRNSQFRHSSSSSAPHVEPTPSHQQKYPYVDKFAEENFAVRQKSEHPEANFAASQKSEENSARRRKPDESFATRQKPEENFAARQKSEERFGGRQKPEENFAASQRSEENFAGRQRSQEDFAARQKSVNDLYALSRLHQLAINTKIPDKKADSPASPPPQTFGDFGRVSEATTLYEEPMQESESTTISSFALPGSLASTAEVQRVPYSTTTEVTTPILPSSQQPTSIQPNLATEPRFGPSSRLRNRDRTSTSSTTSTSTEEPPRRTHHRFAGRNRNFTRPATVRTNSEPASQPINSQESTAEGVSSHAPLAPVRNRFATRQRSSTTQAPSSTPLTTEIESKPKRERLNRGPAERGPYQRRRISTSTPIPEHTQASAEVIDSPPAPAPTPELINRPTSNRTRGRARPNLLRSGRTSTTTTTTPLPTVVVEEAIEPIASSDPLETVAPTLPESSDPAIQRSSDPAPTAQLVEEPANTGTVSQKISVSSSTTVSESEAEPPKKGIAGVLGRLRSRSKGLPTPSTTAQPEVVSTTTERKPSRVGGILNRRKLASTTKEPTYFDAFAASDTGSASQKTIPANGVIIQVSSVVSESEEVPDSFQPLDVAPSPAPAPIVNPILSRLKAQRKPGSIARRFHE